MNAQIVWTLKKKTMSRFIGFSWCPRYNSTKCCGASKYYNINVEDFKQNVLKRINVYNSLRLIAEHSVYLNDKNQTILKIGLSPQHFFQVVARMETNTMNSVILTGDELTKVMKFLSNNFVPDSAGITPAHEKHISGIVFKQIKPRTFALHIGQKYLTLDEDTLNAILWKRLYIEQYVSTLEETRKPYETMLIDMVTHFYYHKKLMKFATEFSQSKHQVYRFFEEIIILHGDCIEASFAIEIGSNFPQWFTKCIPIFIKTMMLNETERLETFSSNLWPHDKKYINVKALAQTGLYFTGESDVAACAFCNIQLHDWKCDDDPILDHHKYSPKFSFLMNPKQCSNVPIGDENKIEQLFCMLPKVNGFDVPDCSRN